MNWNAGPQLRACLASVAAARQDHVRLDRVVVVDNASTDDSLEDLGGLDLPLVLLRNAENRGFAAACNQGAAGSTADYLLFLNPDTEITPDALDRSTRFLEQPEQEGIGLLGVQLVDEAGTVQRTCARFPTPARLLSHMAGLDRFAPERFPGLIMEDWDHRNSREVDHVMGAYFFTRRALFEHLGGFDEGFFVYLEDLDYALRTRQAGWQTYYLADVRIYHRGCGTSEQVRAERLAYVLRSRIRYGFKHLGPAVGAAHLAGVLSIELAARLLHALLRGSRQEFADTLRAYRMLVSPKSEVRGPKSGVPSPESVSSPGRPWSVVRRRRTEGEPNP